MTARNSLRSNAGSQDFIIANHFIEHTEDPIGTIKRFLTVLRPQGILYMAVPDKRFTFDLERPLTSLEHLLRDHTEGPEWSRESHFREWAQFVCSQDRRRRGTRSAAVDADELQHPLSRVDGYYIAAIPIRPPNRICPAVCH